MAKLIVPAPAGVLIEQPAGDVGPGNLAGVAVFELVQAATAAPVAQGLPFARRHLVKRLFQPERFAPSCGRLITGWQHGNRFLKILCRDLAFHGVIAHMR